MQLKVETNAAYLVAKGANSRIAGNFHLQSQQGNLGQVIQNAPITTEYSIIKI